jgi:hypothetical protein
MRYIFSSYQVITERDFREITKDIEKIFIKGSEYAMTLAEIFRREGMEKGIEKGETIALSKVV